MEKLVILFVLYLVANAVKFFSRRSAEAGGQTPTVVPPPARDRPESVLTEMEAYLAGEQRPPGMGQIRSESAPLPGSFPMARQGDRPDTERPELAMQRRSGASSGRPQGSRKKNRQGENRQGAQASGKSGRSASQTRSGRLPQPAASGVSAAQRGQRQTPVTPTSTGGGVRAHVDQHMRSQIEQHVRQDLGTGLAAGPERMDLGSESPSARDSSGRSASLTELLRSPEGVRQAFLVSEILSRPRVFQRIRDRAS